VMEVGDPLLDDMLHKLLAKKPEERFQTAGELMAVLDTVASTLAAKGVLRDFGLRDRGARGIGPMLRRLLRHLPRSSIARLSGRRVALVIGLALAATTFEGWLILFRESDDRAFESVPSERANTPPGRNAGSSPSRAAAAPSPPPPAHVTPARGGTSPTPSAPRTPKSPAPRK
jgi:hypothetical protein